MTHSWRRAQRKSAPYPARRLASAVPCASQRRTQHVAWSAPYPACRLISAPPHKLYNRIPCSLPPSLLFASSEQHRVIHTTRSWSFDQSVLGTWLCLLGRNHGDRVIHQLRIDTVTQRGSHNRHGRIVDTHTRTSTQTSTRSHRPYAHTHIDTVAQSTRTHSRHAHTRTSTRTQSHPEG